MLWMSSKSFKENAAPSKGKCGLCFLGTTFMEADSSAWGTKTERNYKNDQNDTVH